MQTNRKLASVQKIADIQPIEGADKIEFVTVLGWNCVTQKENLFKIHDLVIFCEVDSLLPIADPRFEFLANKGVRTMADGYVGHRLKTIRLRGQYSQGLVLPISEFPEIHNPEVGMDVTELLNIRKYEPAVPACLIGLVRGNFPGWAHKTDAERVQNQPDLFPMDPNLWYCDLKQDGSSATFAVRNNDFHVCSRNMDLKDTEGNTFWLMAKKYDVENKLRALAEKLNAQIVIVQGEVFGHGLNGNRLGLTDQRFEMFNFEVDGKVVPRSEWENLIDLPIVPLMNFVAPVSLADALAQVERLKHPQFPQKDAEGVVWHRKDGTTHGNHRAYKVISNSYLLKEKE